MQYARDSSLTLPRSNLVSSIRKKSHKKGKMQDLTYEEFGENLKILLTKKVSSLDKKYPLTTLYLLLNQLQLLKHIYKLYELIENKQYSF